MPDATARAISDVGASSSLVVGGTKAVSSSVAASLPTSQRLDGADRYATCAKVLEYAGSHGLGWGYVAVAKGGNFPDALSAGPLVAQRGGMLVLLGEAGPSAPVASLVASKRPEVKTVDLIGGTLALSDAAVSKLLGVF
jgi:putative cell wall-binding protein